VQLGAANHAQGEGARRAQRFVAQHWAFPAGASPLSNERLKSINVDSMDTFLAEEKHSFCISGMAFQDAWNLDLERLRECFLHVLSPEQKLVPLCAYNLTGVDGKTLYRSQSATWQGQGVCLVSAIATVIEKTPLESWIAGGSQIHHANSPAKTSSNIN
jgi:hypothetical protein